mmetsp:Transcript_522/g.1577  ORF Transcript_522/g.1577 Transcript_522/m.1577 type:complete len:343 (-) Transcript_522:394-1422(-)
MPPCLAPAAQQCAAVSLLFGSVVQERQEDRSAPDTAFCLQVALGKHVPVLCQVLGVPAPNRRGQDQAERVARKIYVAIDGVCQAGQLIQRGKERRDPNQQRLSQVVFELADGGLPCCQVPLRHPRGQELIRQGLEVALVHLGVVVDDGEDDPGIMPRDAEVLFEDSTELLERPTFVRRLAWQVVRQTGRMVSRKDEPELLAKLLAQGVGLPFTAGFSALKGKHDAEVRPRHAELCKSLHGLSEHRQRRLVVRDHHYVDDIVPVDGQIRPGMRKMPPLFLLALLLGPELAILLVPVLTGSRVDLEEADYGERGHGQGAVQHVEAVEGQRQQHTPSVLAGGTDD